MITIKHRPALALIWGCILFASVVYCILRIASGTAFESNILGLIPADAGAESGAELAEIGGGRFDKRFLILLSHSDSDIGPVLAEKLKKRLAAQPGITIAGGDRDAFAGFREFFRPYRHQLLSPAMRSALQTRDAQSLADEVFNRMHSPVPALRLYSMATDPFNLGGRWLQAVFPDVDRFTGGDIPVIRESDKTWFLIRGRVDGNPFKPVNQQVITGVVNGFAADHEQARLLRSGIVFHAAEAARIARFEISTVGVGSIVGIILLVLSVFRSRLALAAIVFTLTSSVLVALATSLAVFDRVHLVTVAFGSTLLGLAVDYCFHFLVKQQTTGDSRQAGSAVRRGIVLGAGSSIAAYLIQLFSPFTGLHQFAVFMTAGLAAAGGAVAVLSRYYQAPPSPGIHKWLRFYPRYLAPRYAQLARPRRLWFAVLIVIIPLLIMVIAAAGSRDDIRLLNTSSQALLDAEKRVRDLLGVVDGQRYWLVSGRDQQQVLAHSERLLETLGEQSTLPANPAIGIAQLVPSLAQQRRDHALVADKLYGPDGALARLCVLLGNDCRDWQSQFGRFQEGLVPSRLPAQTDVLFPVLQTGSDKTGVVFLRHGVELPESTLERVNRLEGVRFVDQVAKLSGTLAGFRVEVSYLLAVFTALLALGGFAVYRQQGLFILSSVLVAMIVSLAVSAGGGLTLFHVLALLLVLGLSLDAAIFYVELELDGETWTASTMAAMTSILAFGLLSLSQVPVLHYFGTVVFSGLLCAWLVTPLFYNLWGRASPSPAE